MPELPEVQAVTERLAKTLPGRRIIGPRIFRPRLVAPHDPRSFARQLRGARVEAVTRRAKFILLELDRGRTLLAHLRMTGHLFVTPPNTPRKKGTSAAFTLDNGARLMFEDPRGLGVLRLLPRAEAEARLKELGLEPMSPAFTGAALFRMTRGRRLPLKLFLIDQRRIAGLGNIYAAEALWRARLNPRTPAGQLSRAGAARLRRAIVNVLREALEGARKAYRRPSRLRPEGEFQPAVYDREGEPCPRCAWPIRRLVQGARSTFFCPRCQT